MSDWRVGIIHRRWAMHERRWAQGWLARVTEVKIRTKVVIELLRQAQREFVEEIVRMLTIVQRLVVPGFAGLKQERITASTFGQGIEAHHEAAADLGAVAERMRIHAHKPVRRIDSVIAASCAHVGVTRKNRAM